MKLIPNVISRTVSRQVLLTQQSSPAILFGVGIVGVIGATVLACRATLRVEEVVEETNRDIEKMQVREVLSEQAAQRQIWQIRAVGARKIFNLYAPAIGVGAISVIALAGSHRILTRRNAALSAAFTVLDRAFRDYRGRVRNAYGEEIEDAIYNGSDDWKTLPHKPGEKHAQLESATFTQAGPYSVFYDEMNAAGFKSDPEMNKLTIQAAEHFANEKLKIKGHVFLNEVLDMLGIEHTEMGATCGWLVDGGGDGYVDFGLNDNRLSAKRFMTGREAAVILNFNCDPGQIHRSLKKQRNR